MESKLSIIIQATEIQLQIFSLQSDINIFIFTIMTLKCDRMSFVFMKWLKRNKLHYKTYEMWKETYIYVDPW